MLELNNVYQGDCLKLIQEIDDKSIDVCITDLPYGIDYQSNRSKNGKRFDKIANDKKPFVDFIKYLPRVMKETGAVYLFTRWDVQQVVIDELEKYGMRVKNVLIWDKLAHSMGDLRSAYGSRYESIVFAPMNCFYFQGNRPVDIIPCSRISPEKLQHPNEKPTNLLRKLIVDSTKIGGGNFTVLDCTCGSGSTLVAAVRERCNFIGFELDKHYYEIAKKRVEIEKRNRQLSFNFE